MKVAFPLMVAIWFLFSIRTVLAFFAFSLHSSENLQSAVVYQLELITSIIIRIIPVLMCSQLSVIECRELPNLTGLARTVRVLPQVSISSCIVILFSYIQTYSPLLFDRALDSIKYRAIPLEALAKLDSSSTRTDTYACCTSKFKILADVEYFLLRKADLILNPVFRWPVQTL